MGLEIVGKINEQTNGQVEVIFNRDSHVANNEIEVVGVLTDRPSIHESLINFLTWIYYSKKGETSTDLTSEIKSFYYPYHLNR